MTEIGKALCVFILAALKFVWRSLTGREGRQ